MTTYTAKLHHQGQTYTISVPEDQTVLDAAYEQGLELPCSCYTGVCTTCAAQLVSGQVDQSQGMGTGGMGEELDAKGYVLLCVSQPLSDLEIVTEKEDEVYTIRFGGSSA
ncbi:ferredoxin (2Fe-2S) [Thalassoporum mexicanum PCC 7367]|uniref:2Fe-2S iron-sulfur cluster-binding protein n=1 Tax=Thalassoporum mexicanum TaxID=3457544 RepID=UPI00029F968C|nr:2Fe-2S iron-sulfur cluster-binding protein [Pseudanabaena sp. PCC 7367]AFY71275.1 ferredoxin (2Fe-2S) [Pseudanabaena sp. PCC 7367]